MPDPGSVSNQMPGGRPADIAYRLDQLERMVQRMAAARTLENATIDNTPGNGIRTSDFDGTSFADHGAHGNYFGGDGLVVNNSYFRPGSIGNDALTNPVKPDAPYGYRQNFGLTTTLSNIYTLSVPVPAGFTQAAVSITASVYAVNPNTTGGSNGTGGDYLYVQANINGYNGFALPLGISGSNGSGTNRSPFSTVLGGLAAGGSISLQVAASTSFAAFATNSNNTAEITGSISWFR